MFIMRSVILLAVPVMLASCATTPEREARATERAAREAAELARTVEGLVPGEPVNCISPRVAGRSRFLGENTIAYVVSRNFVYVNKPRGGCPGLGNGRGLVTVSRSGQLCSGDFAEVRDFIAGTAHGSCALGEFIPYRKPQE